MWAAAPDPGALSAREYDAGDQRIKVANIFAANDPESTLMNVHTLEEQGVITRPLHLVINCRPDRVERNAQMGKLAESIDPDRIVVIGTPARSAIAAVPARWQSRICDLGGRRSGAEILADILRDVDDSATLVLVGNIHGQGELLLEQLDRLPEVRHGGVTGRRFALPPALRRPIGPSDSDGDRALAGRVLDDVAAAKRVD
jgi:gamma-polyglutamate synthase